MNPYVACRQLIKRRNRQAPTPLLFVVAAAPGTPGALGARVGTTGRFH